MFENQYGRRNYPKDREGGKNEWKAIVKHYEEYDKKGLLMERHAKGLVQETVKNGLFSQIDEAEKMKLYEREKKLSLENDMVRKD